MACHWRTVLSLPDPDDRRHDVMCTSYTYASDDEGPWMLTTSWEPLSLTKGTPIAFPETGPYAGRGVTHRMAAIGVLVDAWGEEVWARPAAPDEARQLGVGAGSIVTVVERSYFAGERVVEAADIIVPTEPTKLVYTGPVGDSTVSP
jgi:GntR family transcriptional regulator